jgi:hypothetical protein
VEIKSVPQREFYNGVAREVAVWWTLRREATEGEAVCRMFTHVFGHELRLEVRGEVVQTQGAGPTRKCWRVSGAGERNSRPRDGDDQCRHLHR